MIIKAFSELLNGWVWFDNIEVVKNVWDLKVSTYTDPQDGHEYLSPLTEKGDKIDWDYAMIKIGEMVNVIYLKKNNGKEIIILYLNKAYLLNDEGKTIEKL